MNELYHYGVKGMKWGVRRYQNYDGTLTEEGKKRNKTVFISGSSKTQDSTSPYYKKDLPKEITKKIDSYIGKNYKIIVGDAPGIDRQVQDYLNKIGYKDVEIYGSGKEVRYSANKKWKTNPIDAPEFEVNSKEYLAKKDIAMSNRASKGLAIILDEGAKATRRNIQRLMRSNKKVDVYSLSKVSKELDKWLSSPELQEILNTKI